jgi:hypothetical protein
MFTQVADGDKGELFVTEQLCMELLKDKTIFLEVERDLNDSFEPSTARAIKAYANFTKSLDANTSMQWPDFDTDSFDRVFHPPGDEKLRTIFDVAFKLVLPFLKRDLFSRVPGRFLRWDGTFEYAKKMMNDASSETDINCVAILFGEHGHVMNGGFIEEEKEEFQQLHYFLRKRWEKLGDKYVKAVVDSWSDTCCEGLDDPSSHWITKFWDSVSRGPGCDLFHLQKRVTDSTRGTSSELHIPFVNAISKACLKYDEASRKHIYNCMTRKKTRGSLRRKLRSFK